MNSVYLLLAPPLRPLLPAVGEPPRRLCHPSSAKEALAHACGDVNTAVGLLLADQPSTPTPTASPTDMPTVLPPTYPLASIAENDKARRRPHNRSTMRAAQRRDLREEAELEALI